MAKKRFHPLTIIGCAGLAWNLIGLVALLGDAYSNDIARYTMTAAQRALDDQTPNWAIVGGMVAVAGGLIGSTGLLLRRSWSVLLLVISLLGLLVQDVGIGIAVWRAGAWPGPVEIALQSLVMIVAVVLLVLAMAARNARELR